MISLVPVITLIVFLLSLLGYQIEDILKYIQENLDLQEHSMNILEHYFLNIPSISKILFGIGIFIAGFTIRLVGKNRKAKSVEKAGKIMMILTIPLIVLAFLEAIGLILMYIVITIRLHTKRL